MLEFFGKLSSCSRISKDTYGVMHIYKQYDAIPVEDAAFLTSLDKRSTLEYCMLLTLLLTNRSSWSRLHFDPTYFAYCGPQGGRILWQSIPTSMWFKSLPVPWEQLIFCMQCKQKNIRSRRQYAMITCRNANKDDQWGQWWMARRTMTFFINFT